MVFLVLGYGKYWEVFEIMNYILYEVCLCYYFVFIKDIIVFFVEFVFGFIIILKLYF